MKTIINKPLVAKIVELVGEKASVITIDVKAGKIIVHTEDLENKIHNLEQYLLTLKPHTPHYKDTKKHIERLKNEKSNYHKR